MEISNGVSGWVSTIFTGLGLSTLIIQASNFLDPFRYLRGQEIMGIWARRQPVTWYNPVNKAKLFGPKLSGSLTEGFCSHNRLRLYRTIPEGCQVGRASWTQMLAVFQPAPRCDIEDKERCSSNRGDLEKGQVQDSVQQKTLEPWSDLPAGVELRLYGNTAHSSRDKFPCIAISRKTLVVLMLLSNVRLCEQYRDGGYRARFAGYNGFWTLDWPIGKPAVVQFFILDNFTGLHDVYPTSFLRRVDKCIYMQCGLIVSSDQQLAFPERRRSGRWILQFLRRGYCGDRGSRLTYDLLGGNSYGVDLLFAKEISEQDAIPDDAVALRIANPLPESGRESTGPIFYIPPDEQRLVQWALDFLPWSQLAWTVHSGMRDILLPFGKKTMHRYRKALSHTLRQAIKGREEILIRRGWDAAVVRQDLADMIDSGILRGNTSLVRAVTEVTLLLCEGVEEDLDVTEFWRASSRESSKQVDDEEELPVDTVVALVKYFALECSFELDHGVFRNLPLELIVV